MQPSTQRENIKDLLGGQMGRVQKLLEDEREHIDQGLDQVKEIATYMKANWKKVIPPLVGLGVSAFFLREGRKHGLMGAALKNGGKIRRAKKPTKKMAK